MKILHIANCGGELEGGGIYQVAKNLFLQQKYENYDVKLIYPSNRREEKKNEIEVIYNFGNNFLLIFNNIFYKKLENFDVVHQHGVFLFTSILSILYSLTKTPVIIQPHGLISKYRTKGSIKKFISLLFIENLNFKLAKAIIVTCKEEENYLRLKFPKANIVLITNGINLDEFKSDHLLKENNLVNKMIFLSKISPVKGLDRLFEAISHVNIQKFNNWKIEIAGTDDFNMVDALQKKCTVYGIDKLITFVGPKSGIDKINFLKQGTVFVLPSFDENFGIVVLESLACGVPVMATKGTPWEDLELFNCGWWVDNTLEAIENCINQILDTSIENLNRMGENSIKLIKNKYEWKTINLSVISLYRNFI